MLTPPCYVTTKLQGLQRRWTAAPVTETFTLPFFYSCLGWLDFLSYRVQSKPHKKRADTRSALYLFKQLNFNEMLKLILWHSFVNHVFGAIYSGKYQRKLPPLRIEGLGAFPPMS
jgi:hypothetical protein